MAAGIFVTGTDTGVGKTRVAVALLRGLAADGFRAVGMKPVAAGVDDGGSGNADVRRLAAASTVVAAPADANPYALAAPIAPHLAAARAGVAIDLDRCAAACRRLAAASDFVVVEGAGGVLVPLGERIDMLDLAQRLGLPLLLVVGIRLGCLNHALLSALAIRTRGLTLAGWVANRVDPAMDAADANVAALAERLGAPPFADLRWAPGDEGAPALRGAARPFGPAA